MPIDKQLDKPNIFIALNSPLTKNVYSRIGIEELKPFFTITLLDFLDFFNKESTTEISFEPYSDENFEIIRIQNVDHVNSILSRKRAIFLLDCIGRSDHTYFIQSLCRQHIINYVHDGLANTISNSKIRNLLLYCLSKFPDFILVPISFIALKIKNKYFIRPDFVLSSSKIGTAWENSSKKRIFSGSRDFFKSEECTKSSNMELNAFNKPFILFLDDCLMDSFDFQLGAKKSNILREDYFTMMKIFFDKIENQYNMPVIIAAHPVGSNYENYDKLFGDRKVFFEKTCELSRDCYFSMTHHSLSVNYPILYNKPIVFLQFDGLLEGVRNLQKEYYRFLGADIFDISKESRHNLKISHVNKKKYKSFTENHIYSSNKFLLHPYEPLINYFVSKD
tara:strand:- start:5900 stop:7075 length:1176 start_codon:yes stop_codon:yes gene_type:complete